MRTLSLLCIPLILGLIGCGGEEKDSDEEDDVGMIVDCVEDCLAHEPMIESTLNIGDGFHSESFQNRCQEAEEITDCVECWMWQDAMFLAPFGVVSDCACIYDPNYSDDCPPADELDAEFCACE